MVPRLDLELRLPGEAYIRLSRSPMRLCRERAAGHRQIHDRADALALELANIELPDAGDEAQMVVGTPAGGHSAASTDTRRSGGRARGRSPAAERARARPPAGGGRSGRTPRTAWWG